MNFLLITPGTFPLQRTANPTCGYCITPSLCAERFCFPSSGGSVSWSDCGLSSSPPALLSQTLLRTLQTSQPGPLSGWPGGRKICMHTHTDTHTHTHTQWVLGLALELIPTTVIGVIVTFKPHVHHSSNNSNPCTSYMLTWHVNLFSDQCGNHTTS